MDFTDFPVSRSPRKELQGPRPPALKVRKDSHKIKKPPIAPAPQASQQAQHQHQQAIYQQPRQPVIIYTVSPKIIHTSPSNFMNLVQRLTGASPTASSTPPNPFNDDIGAISPAARLATVEKASRSPKERNQMLEMSGDVGLMGGIDDMMGQVMEKSTLINPHEILSPGPASLPQISPNFFSPQFDPNSVGFFYDFSPVLQGNRNLMEGNFMPSP